MLSMLASLHGHLKCILPILALGSNHLVKTEDKDGWTPLHLAAQEGHLDIVELFLSMAGLAVSVNAQASNGRTPLHNAVLKGKTHVAEFLIKQGASVVVTDCKKWSPLHVACQHGYYEIVKLIVDRGACINDTIERWSQCTPSCVF